MTAPLLSVVVPVYNEEQCLAAFHAELSSALRQTGLRHEILFIDDGSSDGTWALLGRLREQDPAVSAVSLSRNFGHQIALTAGLDLATGAAVVTLDADLQHPPALIPQMTARWKAGAMVVQMVRAADDGGGRLKSLTSGAFYRLINALSSTPVPPRAADFRLLDRKAVDQLKSMKERHRFLRGMIGWLGLREETIVFTAPPRAAGRTKYTWSKMARLASDGIISFSIIPLRAALWLGVLSIGVNAVYAAYVFYMYFVHAALIKGWASLILLVMFLGSIQLILLGIIGEYLGRTYEEVKNRPLYVIGELLPRRDATSGVPAA